MNNQTDLFKKPVDTSLSIVPNIVYSQRLHLNRLRSICEIINFLESNIDKHDKIFTELESNWKEIKNVRIH